MSFVPQLPLCSAPRSSEHVTNSRGQRLHVRSSWPATPPARMPLVILLHGYGAHTNRPQLLWLTAQLAAHDIACLTLDFHGHGYSQGTRCHVASPDDLLDDVRSLLQALRTHASSPSPSPWPKDDLQKTAEAASSIQPPSWGWTGVDQAPIFLAGHSMGGAVALLLGQQLSVEEKAHNFAGFIGLCPALQISAAIPSWAAGFLGALALVAPTAVVPNFLINPDEGWEDIWVEEEMRAYVRRDGYPHNPEGLAWGLNPRLSTASTLVKLMRRAHSSVEATTFPLLLLHDPEEKVVDIEGSRRLVRFARSASKRLVHIDGGRHDLICNKPEACAKEIVDFVCSIIGAQLTLV